MAEDQKTTEVRIKVMVNKDGRWAAYGYTDATDGDPDDVLYDMMSGEDTTTAREFWITASVPTPQAVEIAAHAVEEEHEGGIL